jgi:hypothetical protein
MSHKFRKPMPISDARRAAARANGANSHGPVTPEGKAKSALNAVTHGLTASAIVLTTESKEKYAALLASYLEQCDPDGPIENDLVEEMVAAKWQQRRVAAMIAALIDVAMDQMEKEIADQFENIDNTVRTVLAFKNQAKESATLALLNRYAARHAREYHRALKHLREIQSERRDQPTPPASPYGKSQNEPKPDVTPEPSTTCDSQTTAPERTTSHESLATHNRSLVPAPYHQSELATRHSSLAAQTGHRPLASDHCIFQNEPKPIETHEPSTPCRPQAEGENGPN